MLTDSTSTTSNSSIWGIVIFFLILFWFFGAGGVRNGFAAGVAGGMAANNNDPETLRHTHQTERDALTLGREIVEQNAQTAKTLSDMAYAQEAQTTKILDGQKDLYIRDLERIATQQFVTGQTNALSAKMDSMASAAALQRQADNANINAQLESIQNAMLKAPTFYPYGGLGTIGCNNMNSCCSCNS